MSRYGVNGRQSFVQCLVADVLHFGFDLLAKLPIGRRAVKHASQKRFEIQRRATDEQHFFSACMDLSDFFHGSFAILADTTRLVWVANIDQMMGD